MAGQGATCKDGFCVHVPHDIGHTNWKSACPHQSSKQNTHQEAVEHIQGAREGVRADCGCDIGSVDTENC